MGFPKGKARNVVAGPQPVKRFVMFFLITFFAIPPIYKRNSN